MTHDRSPNGPPAPLSAEDRLDIMDAVGGIMLQVDVKDWDKVRRYLMPEVSTDYTSIFGGDPVTCDSDVFVQGLRSRLPGFDATQHIVTQISVSGSGDHAMTISNLRAAHWIESDIWAFGGAYRHTLTRTAEGWRIASLAIEMHYEEGDRAVRDAAVERMSARLGMSVEELTVIGRSQNQVNT